MFHFNDGCIKSSYKSASPVQSKKSFESGRNSEKMSYTYAGTFALAPRSLFGNSQGSLAFD